MRKLLNTLYVTSENSYLALDGENLVVYDEKKELGRLPLHNLDGIVSFGYRGTSPALMGACAERNISLCYLTPQGKFLARVTGKVQGNVLLREQQYKSSKDDEISLTIAKNCIMGKVYNARWVLERAIRDHGMQIDVEGVKKASLHLKESLQYIQNAESKDQLRGYEGEAASIYFGVFNELILQQKKEFNFQGRNKRPPKDNVNAMLSFVYTLLTNQINQNYTELDFYDLYEKMYYMKYGKQVPYEANYGGAEYEVPKDEFEEVIKTYLPFSNSEIEKGTFYNSDNRTFRYRPRGLYDCEFPYEPYPEVISYEKLQDGTLKLTIEAVWEIRMLDQAITSELMIKPMEDGSFQYLSNKVIKSDQNANAGWYMPRLTEEEWEENYSNN